ncbi:hypothetical protein BO83DRAFT_199509 [Aspergillus eucalypticola CBS 122712]|uniref:Uncharacterized protein n=1 Tax=Aspergillus eucalypticola (strain CBS 122712 / IBT 29274) TaxID=1448314 RepID=A0A317W737_ASPEC|nr:uncharacterized protein BO83DRAFT_199509 [Aspergillus eucalypticola CBS 122712]PWY79950.1 hypothetical protein BO83DRAFT_199509 [Aspergillus eucalypticola CBS 122712]
MKKLFLTFSINNSISILLSIFIPFLSYLGLEQPSSLFLGCPFLFLSRLVRSTVVASTHTHTHTHTRYHILSSAHQGFLTPPQINPREEKAEEGNRHLDSSSVLSFL